MCYLERTNLLAIPAVVTSVYYRVYLLLDGGCYLHLDRPLCSSILQQYNPYISIQPIHINTSHAISIQAMPYQYNPYISIQAIHINTSHAYHTYYSLISVLIYLRGLQVSFSPLELITSQLEILPLFLRQYRS